MNAALVLLLIVAVATVGVLSTSPPNCKDVTCDTASCAPVSCTCGSYKGSCGCCDYCHKCAGETCIKLRNERCQEGYECKLNDPEASIFQGAPGTCVAATPHDHAHHDR